MFCIVHARASSKRFKKKIFELVNSKSILQHVIENIKACNSISKIIVDTSNQQDDDETETKNETENFNNYLKTIAKQINQIENLVNEFSDFARMPKPIFDNNKIVEIIKNNISLLKEIDQSILIK